MSPIICWVEPASRIICKYLEIRTIIILGNINIDIEVLEVGVEMNVCDINGMWQIVDLNFIDISI